MEPKTTGKRIVSKGAYAKKQAERAADGVLGTVVWLAAAICALLTIRLLVGSVAFLLSREFAFMALCLFAAFWTGFAAYIVYLIGLILMKEVVDIDPGLPSPAPTLPTCPRLRA